MKRLLLMALLFSFFSTNCMAKEYLVSKNINMSVTKAMNHLESILKKKNFSIFKRINHKENAHKKGLSMKANEVIIFGNPIVGTKLMIENPMMGLALPLKISISEVTDNTSVLVYVNPQFYLSSFGIKNIKLVGKISKALNAITTF